MSHAADPIDHDLHCSPDWYDGPQKAEHSPEDVKEFFAELRERGLVTIEGEGCCSGCTAGAAHDHAEEHDAIGYAGYHEQNVERGYSDMYLFFGSAAEHVEDEEIGAIICSAADDMGIEYEWEGDVSVKVQVFF